WLHLRGDANWLGVDWLPARVDWEHDPSKRAVLTAELDAAFQISPYQVANDAHAQAAGPLRIEVWRQPYAIVPHLDHDVPAIDVAPYRDPTLSFIREGV